jgi:Cu(I)/Ag(I) efflux system membrane fusion protein
VVVQLKPDQIKQHAPKPKKDSMRRGAYLMGLLAAMIAAYLAGTWNREYRASASGKAGGRILYYHDPMHPAYRSDKPGIAPDCGMQLEPVYETEENAPGNPQISVSLPPGMLSVSAEKQQAIGVRTGLVERVGVDHRLRTVGRVAVDEARTVRITAADGYIEKISPVAEGSIVRKDDLLGTFYTKEFLPAQVAYLYSVTHGQQFRGPAESNPANQYQTASSIQYQSPEKELRILGMSDYQIREIARTQKPATEIDLRAPSDGLILSRKVTLGMKLERGDELYRIADLSRAWIMADVFESEARYLRPGMEAVVQIPGEGKSLRARIANVLPRFDPASRLFKVRLEATNPGYELRPDMFVDVEIGMRLPPAMMVPAEAVIDTGMQKRVYVEIGAGTFASRPVETGLHSGDLVEIVSGLKENDRIVLEGNFLIDSESRMKTAAENGRKPEANDPVCGMRVDPAVPATRGEEFHGKTYYFCSGHCKDLFEASPERYAGPAAGNQVRP